MSTTATVTSITLPDLVDAYAAAKEAADKATKALDSAKAALWQEAGIAERALDEPIELVGRYHIVRLTAAQKERVLKKGAVAALYERWGAAQFFDLCTIALSKIDALIPEPERAHYVDRVQGTTRKTTIVERR